MVAMSIKFPVLHIFAVHATLLLVRTCMIADSIRIACFLQSSTKGSGNVLCLGGIETEIGFVRVFYCLKIKTLSAGLYDIQQISD